jgi:hypothetical protein
MIAVDLFDYYTFPDPNSGCFIFMGTIGPSGRGRFKHNRITRMAHDVAYEMNFGKIPDGYRVIQSCGTKACINPDHLQAIQTGEKAVLSRIHARNRAFVDGVNARTFCAHCGKQPIEWHNPEHVELNRERFRIGDMIRGHRTLEAIQTEMDRCTPLCRRCHMAEDGRLHRFIVVAERPKPKSHPMPCVQCSRLYKPLRRGLCNACNHRQRFVARRAAERAARAEGRQP